MQRENKMEPQETQSRESVPKIAREDVIKTKNNNIKSSFCDETDKEIKEITMRTSLCRPFSVGCLKKKLIVLDINGLLAAVVSPLPEGHTPDTIIARKAIFKRPYYLEFLNFCFEKFEVAIWSSRTKRNIDMVIDYLMGNMKHKLLFCWDASQCTVTSYKTLENKFKPLVFKDLRKIWDKYNDPYHPWRNGYYNESNTLLLDDSPYKALLNPPHNSVFPHTFSFRNRNDNSLGAGGDLRIFLDGLANAESLKKYVEEHPFGQEAISERSESWNFYCNVIRSLPARK